MKWHILCRVGCKILSRSIKFKLCHTHCSAANCKLVCILCSYPDVVLATLLCIRANLCRRRCEIKVNDMVFVGYPMQMPAASGAASSAHTSPSTCSSQSQVVQPSPKREQSSTVSYNIVFAVKVLLFTVVLYFVQYPCWKMWPKLLVTQQDCFLMQKQLSISDHHYRPRGSTQSCRHQVVTVSHILSSHSQSYLCDSVEDCLPVNVLVSVKQ